LGTTGVAAGLVAQRELTAQGLSRVRNATASEPALPYASWLSPLPLRFCRQTDGRSQVRWEAQPVGGGPIGRIRFRFATANGFVSKPAGGFRLKIQDLPEIGLEASVGDASWSSVDGRVNIRYVVREQNEEDSCGVLEVDVPPTIKAAANGWVRFELTGGAAASERWFGLYEVPGTWE